ncbi:hypothetical protein B0H63DRAFT_530964 [Podospora didyma]|uniref:Protein kinase domain-containing protein n=1 Tax=Podospora didyma TaxID=330526 RepID=A0AAE0P4T8_9PEZI|nr:hypothetical protein B0H63DRAFT_530964 [Podospora didyma]
MASYEDFKPEWVWVDNDGTNVYAQGYGRGLTVIFSFSIDKALPPTSLGNRVCTKYEGIEVDDPAQTFPTIPDMRAAVWDSIRHIWPHCSVHPDLNKLDAVVGIESIDSSIEKVAWHIYSHPLFPRFMQNLADETLGHTLPGPDSLGAMDLANLIRYEQLGGRGCTTPGTDFRTALHHSDDEGDNTIRNLIRSWREEYNTLQNLPPHHNILPPPRTLVTIQWPDQSAKPNVCGALFPFYPGGSVASRIEESNEEGIRISLETYHMDIKPGNFIADERDRLILCDWEQNDAPATTIAPEADETWDVTEGLHFKPGRPLLDYTPYTGTDLDGEGEGDDEGEDDGEGEGEGEGGDDAVDDAPWHKRNVFPIWSKEHPLAVELAEVFSLGSSMWMLLRQPEDDFEEIELPNELITDWDECDDIPKEWVQMVDRCMAPDPNERPDLSEVFDFWSNELRDQNHFED